MRVLLTHPSSNYPLRTVLGLKSPPLGLAYLGAVAERSGHEVRIVDGPTLGLSNLEIVARVVDCKPDLLGVSTTAIGYHHALQMIIAARRSLPRLHTVMGGPQVSFTDKDAMRHCPELDIVVRGEGEETFRDVLACLDGRGELSGVQGITYRANGQIHRTPDRPAIQDLDTIVFPAHHLLPMEQYKFGSAGRYAGILSSRGCPYQCTFCSSSHLFGGKWRCRSSGNVVDEIQLLVDRFGVRHIDFVDDTFTVSAKRVGRLCDLLLDRRLDIRWAASCRVGSLTLEQARRMKEAGCRLLYLGFESASQEVLDSLCKGIRIDKASETMDIVRRAGLDSMGSFIIGSPADTVESIRETIRLSRALPLSYAQFTLLTPFPGTPLYEQLKTDGQIEDLDWADYTMILPTIKHPTIPDKTLRRYLARAYFGFYLRPRHIWWELRSGNFYFVPRALRSLFRRSH